MSIVITIVKFPENVANTKPTITFAENGGTIGRGPDNSWVLEDPERYISTCHSKISYENGQYYLVDNSTNGTFLNGANEPIGKDNKALLDDGAVFSLGDYEFQVSVWNTNQQPPASPFAASESGGPFADPPPLPVADESENFAGDPFTPPTDSFASEFNNQSDPFASPMPGHFSSTDPVISGGMDETDPLAALDKANNSFSTPSPAPLPFESELFAESSVNPLPVESDVFSLNSQSDQAGALDQSVTWPDSVHDAGMIPEDWDDLGSDLVSNPSITDSSNIIPESPQPDTLIPPVERQPTVEAAQSAKKKKSDLSLEDRKRLLEKANRKIQAEIKLLKQQSRVSKQKAEAATPAAAPKATARAREVTASDQTLIEAMGLDKSALTNEQIIEISQVVGEVVRETISGMMQVLSSRSSIKNEFRMNVTTIQPVENNPLKFSANIDDAMENMFLKSGNAFIKPVEAVREGFDGIAEHQVAILAGIRSAFKGVIERFDPQTLEKRFEKFHKGGIIPGSTKAKNWESYTAYYNDLVDDLDNSFQHLFGYEFVQAYEDQLQKLAIARKTKL